MVPAPALNPLPRCCGASSPLSSIPTARAPASVACSSSRSWACGKDSRGALTLFAGGARRLEGELSGDVDARIAPADFDWESNDCGEVLGALALPACAEKASEQTGQL